MSNQTAKSLYHTRQIKELEQNAINNGIDVNLLMNRDYSVKNLDLSELAKYLPKRKRSANKGDFGHVLIVGGDFGMGGAVSMAGAAALRVGAGLVTIATHKEHIAAINARYPEIMCFAVESARQLKPLLEKATVIVVGPGLGKSKWSEHLLRVIISSTTAKVCDADALNLLKTGIANAIYTPHPGEAARMLQVSTNEIQKDRFAAIVSLQKKYGGICALKGFGTLVKGEDEKIGLCSFGNPGMASGGMGDILSGIIGGLLAQGLSLIKAAEFGVCLHAIAGDLAAKELGERGLLATDLLSYIRRLVNEKV